MMTVMFSLAGVGIIAFGLLAIGLVFFMQGERP